MPSISICIPTFNRADFLTQAIASIQAQTYHDWELWVCDDGSTDETPQVMARYQDDRIRYLRHEHHIGKSNNMRSGYEVATGDYFLKLDDDDRLTPHFLLKTSEILTHAPEIDFVSTDHWVIDAHNQQQVELTEHNSHKWGRSQLPAGRIADLLTTVFVQQSLQIGATLFRLSCLRELDFMRRDWQNCEDNDLFVRLALARKQAYYLPDRLMEYRFHAEQQGIDRAIPYLRGKLQYLQAYQFLDASLEQVRRSRFAETQLLLGLRLVEAGETTEGRHLLQAGHHFSPRKAIVGQAFSYLPQTIRKPVFAAVRSIVR
ncbi:MAG: glycosyltransferase family A protein [Synechococcales bacterium]|nr:glycosyltransferase family A protein [Synechococcales bacterium]